MQVNAASEKIHTHEGAVAKKISLEKEFERSVYSCLLWEDEFYEEGIAISKRIADMVPKLSFDFLTKTALKARNEMKLRHMPLFIVREMARHGMPISDLLAAVIQRPDEITEFLAMYWSEPKFINNPNYGKTDRYFIRSSIDTKTKQFLTFVTKKQPISKAVKKGLAKAFTKFDEYQLAKWNRDSVIKLRDAMVMIHPKPLNEEQAKLWKALLSDTLETPDTWEVASSAKKDMKKEWTRLVDENKLGGMAVLMNLRNMQKANVESETIRKAISQMNVTRVFPFRFISAARFAPSYESILETKMFECLKGLEMLDGDTVFLIDLSGSMKDPLSSNSDLRRIDAACGLVMITRELCKNISIFTFSKQLVEIPNRRGFALRDSILQSQPMKDTFLKMAITKINETIKYDRLIIISDEQSNDGIADPLPGTIGYMINVASATNGIGYYDWVHLDGMSENIIRFLIKNEEFVKGEV